MLFILVLILLKLEIWKQVVHLDSESTDILIDYKWPDIVFVPTGTQERFWDRKSYYSKIATYFSWSSINQMSVANGLSLMTNDTFNSNKDL